MEEPILDDEELTTVQIAKGTLRKLGIVAKAHDRTKTAQIRYMTNREYAELERLKLLPQEETAPTLPAVDQTA